MAFSPLFVATCLISTVLASVGPTADLTLTNGDVAPDGFTRQAVLVNGGSPGPLIKANKGDEFNLNVIDKLSNETMLLSSSIHWHGFFPAERQQLGRWCRVRDPMPHRHGQFFPLHIPYVRSPNRTIRPARSGTIRISVRPSPSPICVNRPQFEFISSATQYCDGLRGPLVVYDPEDPNASLYGRSKLFFPLCVVLNTMNKPRCRRRNDRYYTRRLVGVNHGPAKTLGNVPTLISTLINGLGRFAGGPTSQLAVISVTKGKRYRMRLISMSCDPNFIFTIDGHDMTIIEADSVNTQPLTVDSIQIFAGQRYSFVLNANQDIGNYFIRTVANGGTAGFDNGINSAILRYTGANETDPTTTQTTSTKPLVETDLHPLVATAVPGKPVAGGADVTMNLAIALNFTTFKFNINGNTYTPPTAPVLLQILSGAQSATDLLPAGSVFTLPPNSVVELSIPGGSPGAPHPFHLHGHNFFVIKSAGNSTFNFDNPVIRDVVTTGTSTSDNTTIRFVTDNAGPWILHCHIDFHLELGLALVFAEDTAKTLTSSPASRYVSFPYLYRTHMDAPSAAWDSLCPTYDALPADQQ
ncbi:Laccase A [Mycena venus]|uniref:Laccase A n=1 Tax=Mycena venus TaxID=2733690 RepID=A0A8H7D5Z3_9AGAR|nr:Laccase A [Mycena venus]